MTASPVPASLQYLRETRRVFVFRGEGRDINILGMCRLPWDGPLGIGLPIEVEQEDRSYQKFTIALISFSDGSQVWAVHLQDHQAADMLPCFVGNH